MTINFSIPEWVLWVVGVPTGIALVGLSIIGALFLWEFRKGLY